MQITTAIDIDGEVCFDSNRVANYISEFYTSIASSLVNKLPPAKNIFSTESDVFKEHYKSKNVCSNAFKLSPVTIDFLYKELLRLKSNKSTGPDGIHAKFLKDGAVVIKDHITFIINLSITSNSVPTDMKFARVRPLFKKNSRSDVGNYRPVSILSVVSKILELAVYNQLEEYLSEKNLIYSLHLVSEAHTLLIHALFTSQIISDHRWLLVNTLVWCFWICRRHSTQ